MCPRGKSRCVPALTLAEAVPYLLLRDSGPAITEAGLIVGQRAPLLRALHRVALHESCAASRHTASFAKPGRFKTFSVESPWKTSSTRQGQSSHVRFDGQMIKLPTLTNCAWCIHPLLKSSLLLQTLVFADQLRSPCVQFAFMSGRAVSKRNKSIKYSLCQIRGHRPEGPRLPVHVRGPLRALDQD